MSRSKQVLLWDKLFACAEDAVCWSGGSDRPWEGDALTTSAFIEALLQLAINAPAGDIEAFIAEHSDQ